jgi:putative ABC transport system permease protein
MAIGIGVNAAIFRLVETVLFHSVPAEDPRSLVRVFSVSKRGGSDIWTPSYPVYQDYASQSDAFTGLAAYRESIGAHLSFEGRAAEPATAAVVTGNYFAVLGLHAVSGRLLRPDDDRPEASPVAVISDGLWRRRFGAAPDVIGRVVKVNGTAFAIVGVGPRAFSGLDLGPPSELWVPFSWIVEVLPSMRGQVGFRSTEVFGVVGRLRSGVTREQAQARLDTIAAQLGAGEPMSAEAAGGEGMEEPWPRLLPIGATRFRQPIQLSVLLLLAASLVLLTACLNVAGLLLARAERTRRVTAVHLALGAPRYRLLRQVLFETTIYGAAGAIVGIALGRAATLALLRFAPPELPLPITGPSELSARVLGLTIAASLIASLLASLAPIHRILREDAFSLIARNASFVRLGRRRLPLRRLFVVLQVATSAVLLVGAGLFLRTLRNINVIDSGVAVDRVAVAVVDPARGGYGKAEGEELIRRLLESIRRSPVASVAAISTDVPPLTYPTSVFEDRQIGLGIVGPGYFEALGIPLLKGRDFTSADRKGSTRVAVVNRACADAFWPNQDSIGMYVSDVGPKRQDVRVVGIVENVRNRDLLEPAGPALYVPFEQFHDAYSWQRGAVLAVSTKVAPEASLSAIRSAIAEVDPTLFARVETLRQTLAQSFAQARFLALLLSSLGLLVVVIAAAGLSALISQDTASRSFELAVRAALGARPADLRRLIRSESLSIVVVGLAVGLPAALMLGRLISARLYGVPVADVWTLLTVTASLAALGVGAAHGPMRRALRRGIAETLRAE